MGKRDVISICDLDPAEVHRIAIRAHEIKMGDVPKILGGYSLALLFEKPSLRTRASFEVGIQMLGGHSFYMGSSEVGLGVRESEADVAKVLSRWVRCVIARVFSDESLRKFARNSSVPVINALSDWEHPCQALADLQTVYEHKNRLDNLKVVFVGDGNNVARSLALAVASVGSQFICVSPNGYELDEQTVITACNRSPHRNQDKSVVLVTDVGHAVQGADVVYTDVWTSMGDESEIEKRRKAFAGYTVDDKLMSMAKSDAIFMHDMPAHYGEEVSPGMLDHRQSVVFDQAENRLYAQVALLELLLR